MNTFLLNLWMIFVFVEIEVILRNTGNKFHTICTLGLRPQPRIWLKWNLSRLEPPHIKMREEIMNQAKNADKKSKLLINNINNLLTRK